MKKTMNNFFRLKPLSILCLSLASLTIFSACRDDIADEPDREHQNAQVKPLEDYIGKVNIAIEADVIPMSDQEGRGLSYSLIDRSQKIAVDGNTVPSDADYTDEVAPRMALKEGDTERGFLIFYHDNGTVVRESVDFKVIEGVKKKDGTIDPTAKNRVQYVGDIDFPAGVTLKEEFDNSINSTISSPYPQRISPTNTNKNSRWHVMAMIGYQDATSYFSNQDATGTEIKNRLLIGSNNGTRYKLTPSESFDDTFGLEGSINLNTPCASAWMPLHITKAPGSATVTGVNLDLHFKPQGVILQYDIASMTAETQDLRRVGLVSNVLDFGGYYDLNSASIQQAFKTKDGNNYGLPKWIPDNPSMEDLSMHYTPRSDAHLSNGERVFPWDMPTLSSNHVSALENWATPGTNKWEVEQGSVLSVYPLGFNDNKTTLRPSSYPWLKASKLWTFYALGGKKLFKTRNGSQKILYFWGMPRTEARMPEASKRATYLFASSYSLLTDDDAWEAPSSFDTDKLKKLTTLATDNSNKLLTLEKQIKETTDSTKKEQLQKDYNTLKKDTESEGKNPYRAIFPGPIFEAAREAINKASEYTRDANNTKITPRTQPLMVLHQTNRTFPERKVYHAQVIIRPDLMLSEVIYQKHNGQNYSLLEVYNTTVEPVDLTQYAIVRLIPSTDGSHLAFRGPNGQPVESLSQALVLPLTALKGKKDPFDGSALTSLKQAGYNYDDPTKRTNPIFYREAWTIELGGFWSGEWAYNHLEDKSSTHPGRSFYLLGQQSILLGGSGYVNTPVTKGVASYPNPVELVEPEGWFKPLHGLLETNYNKHYLRYAYAYADGAKTNNAFGEGTLDFEPGNAFALIKKTSTGWQIIDATGPVGPEHLAFAGTYENFKTEMAKYKDSENFSQQRLDGVNYPFIAPFRTKRLHPSQWSDDWSIKTEVSQFTPGRRFAYNGWDLSFGEWSSHLKRTPIDENFSTYQNARPTKGH